MKYLTKNGEIKEFTPKFVVLLESDGKFTAEIGNKFPVPSKNGSYYNYDDNIADGEYNRLKLPVDRIERTVKLNSFFRFWQNCNELAEKVHSERLGELEYLQRRFDNFLIGTENSC